MILDVRKNSTIKGIERMRKVSTHQKNLNYLERGSVKKSLTAGWKGIKELDFIKDSLLSSVAEKTTYLSDLNDNITSYIDMIIDRVESIPDDPLDSRPPAKLIGVLHSYKKTVLEGVESMEETLKETEALVKKIKKKLSTVRFKDF